MTEIFQDTGSTNDEMVETDPNLKEYGSLHSRSLVFSHWTGG